jgi:hypothetical protein
MDRAWITLCAVAGAFAVALLSILVGYRLFVIGAAGGFRFGAAPADESIGFLSVAPGIVVALFGMALAAWTVQRALKT